MGHPVCDFLFDTFGVCISFWLDKHLDVSMRTNVRDMSTDLEYSIGVIYA